jgi:beta-glucosidase
VHRIASLRSPESLLFPHGFVWGVSTCAYQIEGALNVDGRGPSVWDSFCRIPGRVMDGTTAKVACDHYHRWSEDLALLRELGARAYRFSIAWPRVQPEGHGPPNPKGLDFYDRLVDELLRLGIEPWVCLHHWDLPQASENRGGWRSRETAHRFADYAALVARRLSDRARRWITLNEPNVEACAGYVVGWHPPGRQSLTQGVAATHHLLLAHGLAVAALRALEAGLEVGIILALAPVLPAAPRWRDRFAAYLVDLVFQRAVADPVLAGTYPRPLLALLAPWIRPGDAALIGARLDFLGLNHYTHIRVTTGGRGPFGIVQAPPPAGATVTAMGFEVVPESFFEQLLALKTRYGNPPVYVTENGFGLRESPDEREFVDDRDRIAFLRSYLAAMHEAIRRGCDVRGWFVWTLLDGFEWIDGFEKRFGLVRVEPETLRRVPKASFAFVRDVFAANDL